MCAYVLLRAHSGTGQVLRVILSHDTGIWWTVCPIEDLTLAFDRSIPQNLLVVEIGTSIAVIFRGSMNCLQCGKKVPLHRALLNSKTAARGTRSSS